MEGKKLLAWFSKNYRKDNGDWNTVALTLEEEQEVREAHRQDLIDIFRECHEDAQELTNTTVEINLIATALFEKRGDKVFTVLDNKLTEKVNKIRNGKGD